MLVCRLVLLLVYFLFLKTEMFYDILGVPAAGRSGGQAFRSYAVGLRPGPVSASILNAKFWFEKKVLSKHKVYRSRLFQFNFKT